MADTPSLAPRPTGAPGWRPPASACDSHAHVFGAAAQFPPAPGAAYPPPPAPVEAYLAALDTLGVAWGVLVQPAPYREDNSAMLDALGRSSGRLRGIALASPEVSDDTLGALVSAGVRGLRFSYFPGPGAHIGTIGLDALHALAPRMREHGLHAQLWLPASEFVEHAAKLLTLGLPLVLDHMARPEPARGLQDPTFQRLLGLVQDNDVWLKLVPHRVSDQFPDYPELTPFHAALVGARPDRMLWGTDWPFVRMGDKTPDAGHLLDLFGRWTPDPALRQAIMVDNPARLYGFGRA